MTTKTAQHNPLTEKERPTWHQEEKQSQLKSQHQK